MPLLDLALTSLISVISDGIQKSEISVIAIMIAIIIYLHFKDR